MLAAVDQLTKGTIAIMHQVALLQAEVSSLRKANEALSKRRRAKRTRIQLGGSLTVQGAQETLGQGAVGGEGVQETQLSGSGTGGGRTKVRCCGVCSKPGHNARTCQEVAESSDSTVSDVIIVGS
jgi:ABC-type phosphate transport system substrate-binding protein